jgi:sec-independent protein translocase protein TatA
MFGLGVQELVVILVIILLLFGGKKLPELGKGIGDSIRNIKDSAGDKKKDE